LPDQPVFIDETALTGCDSLPPKRSRTDGRTSQDSHDTETG
jgi:hypothetical protein